MDIFLAIVAILTLFFTCLSYYDTKKKDKAKIGIYSASWYKDDSNPFLIWFDVFNESYFPITVTKIEILDKDNKPVKIVENHKFKVRRKEPKRQMNLPLGHTMDLAPNIDLSHLDFALYQFYNESRLIAPEIIPTNKSETYKYYIRNFSEDMKIRITSDKVLKGLFTKTRTYDVHFIESED
ncbi:hypothetical protein [Streptococcus parauberis]|uniref:hypothetical protein n=1 Tax=Streptococcus parauberis TaxID=1348 RepID=UPI000C14F02B|nr:hypothetical protein [Streptococcus parauberis]PIA83757.1 hypothetical protein ADO07_01626 [Streptococcus parauberis]